MSEIVLMWTAVTLYALGAILFVFGAVFGSARTLSIALWVSLAGLVPQGAAIAFRWVEVGHGPYLGFYEVVSSYAFGSVIALGAIAWLKPQLKVVGVVIMPVAVLLLGGAMLAPKSPLEITATLASYWLTIHVTFAKLSYTSFVAAFAISLVLLVREKRAASGHGGPMLSRLPPRPSLTTCRSDSSQWVSSS